MQLSIYTKSPDAQAVSYLLAKNPNTIYERNSKGHAVRFVYHTMTDDELYATFFVTPDPLALVNHEQVYDITHYINDREFAVSTIFLSLIRSALGTALNGKPKEDYVQYVSQKFPFTFEIGPVATGMSDEDIRALWEPLGYTVAIQGVSNEKRARFLKLTNEITLQGALQQLFILIPVMDDYKHYFIDESEQERLKHYGEGWIETHPMRDFIYKKALRFRHLLNHDEAPKPQRVSLNTQRYAAIVKHVEKLTHSVVVDMGAGEGKLTEPLAQLKTIDTLYAVDPSNAALQKMHNRFAEADLKVKPNIQWGSLYYVDETFNGADVFILCEVIEHINEERLPQMMQLVTEMYAPKNIIVSTPNAEYNTVYALGDLRHDDHRFEWTRQQFRDWCEMVAPQYELQYVGIGDEHETYGTPTQMCIMTRRD